MNTHTDSSKEEEAHKHDEEDSSAHSHSESTEALHGNNEDGPKGWRLSWTRQCNPGRWYFPLLLGGSFLYITLAELIPIQLKKTRMHWFPIALMLGSLIAGFAVFLFIVHYTGRSH